LPVNYLFLNDTGNLEVRFSVAVIMPVWQYLLDGKKLYLAPREARELLRQRIEPRW